MTTSRLLRRVMRSLGYFVLVAVLLAAGTLSWFRWSASVREARAAADVAPAIGRFVGAADVRMFVLEEGASGAPPVVFIHGTGAWSESWRDTLTAVAGAGFRAVALDLPPFGYSERPQNTGYDTPSQARRILGAMDSLGIQQAVLVGHSFGGRPTMEAALAAPERVRALVLVDVALDIDPGPAESAGAVQTLLGIAPLRDAAVATFLTNPRFTKRLLQQFIANPAIATPERVGIYQRPLVVAGTTVAVGEWLPTLLLPQSPSLASKSANYARLRVPIQVIWGAADTVTPLAQGERLVKLFPSARLAVMQGVGHIPQIEDTAQFNQLLLDFLMDRQTVAKGVSDER